MSGPPTDIPPSALWAKLASAERPSKVVDFPRKDKNGDSFGQIAMRPLTQMEQMSCSKAAEDTAKKHLKETKREDLGYERLYSDAYILETLYRAARNPENVAYPAFPTPKSLSEALTTDECAMLYEHYLTVKLELGPLITEMSEDELEAWIDRLVEGGSAFPFDLISLELQKILVLYMAYQLRSSPTGSSSPGSPAEEKSLENEEKQPESPEPGSFDIAE